MPEISMFYGIVIKMFFDDHAPPHFHAQYGSDEVIININALAVIAGKIPPRGMGLVMDLSMPEEIQLVEDLWDDIASHPELVPVPEWQKSELDQRKADRKKNHKAVSTWEDVKKRIQS